MEHAPTAATGQEPFQRRTKTGCLTCKRVKCDEAKPSCLKCTSTGRKCDGYKAISPPRRDVRIRQPAILPQIFQHSWSAQEVRSFQFFYERTVPSLAGYCGSEFWSGFVLQASQHEKSIWYSLIALGSLHEHFENNQQTPGLRLSRRGDDRFAVRQYVAAITALRGSMHAQPLLGLGDSTPRSSTLTVDVCLISCILFTLIEIMSSRYVSAISHVRTGIKILEDVYRHPSSATYHHPFLSPSTVTSLEMGVCRKFLFRLQSQAYTLTREQADKFSPLQIQNEETCYNTIPATFTSIAEAYDYLEHHIREFHCRHGEIVESTIAPMETELHANLYQRYESLLSQWSEALLRFEQLRGSLLTYKERIGLNVLRIHQYQYFILSDSYSGQQEAEVHAWDKYNPIFEQIVSLAASVVDMTDDTASIQSPVNPSFSLDMGIIPILYNTATLCRDPAIRRRAVSILHHASRQEGLLNSHICAVMAERVIALEESAALAGSLESEQILASVRSLALDQQQQSRPQNHIKRAADVPDTARLALAYPVFDTVRKKAYFIANTEGVDRKFDFPAMTTILDMDQ